MLTKILLSLLIHAANAEEPKIPVLKQKITELKPMNDTFSKSFKGAYDPGAQPWEIVHQERREAKTEEEIRILFSAFRESFVNDRAEETEFAAAEITHWKWTQPTICAPGDPRLLRETIDIEVRTKSIDGSQGAHASGSSGMPYSDPCT